MNRPLIGRDEELATVLGRLGGNRPSGCLTIEAPAGLGKSSLVEAIVAAADERGARVLRCRPAAAERDLSYAALGDLLAPVSDLTTIDPVPRRALERVLARGAAPDDRERREPVEPRNVGLAVRAVVEQMVAGHPDGVLVIVDDLHWADPESAAAIAFVARRLPATGVLLVAARRTTEPAVALDGDIMPLAPLPTDAVRRIVNRSTAMGARPTPRQMQAIVDIAAGNPLFALELGRGLGSEALDADLAVAVPSSLDAIIGRRVDTLPAEVIEALAMVGLMARPTVAMLRKVGVADALAVAEADGLVTTVGGRVAFGHPLYGAAIVQRTPPMQRRVLHRRLSEVVDDAAEAARHAGLAAEEPDSALATRLAGAAAELSVRAAFEQAAELALLAATLTPIDDAERSGRLVSAAELAFQCGETERARLLLDDLDRSATTSAVRVRESLVRATIAYSTETTADAARHARAALDDAATDEDRIAAHSILARVMWDDFPTAAHHAAIALQLAEHADVSRATMASVLVASAGTRLMAGGGLDRAMYERAIELEREITVFSADSAYGSLAGLLKIVDEFDEARAMLLRMVDDLSDEGSMPYALSHLPQLELWTGNWDAAEEYANRHLEAAERTGQHDQVLQAQTNLATINAHRGDVADAVRLATKLSDDGRAGGDPWYERNGAGLLGFAALCDGDAHRAAANLDRWQALSDQMGLREPGYCRFEVDHVEALVACGRLDDATRVVARMQADAGRFPRPRLIGATARAAALIDAARGSRVSSLAAARLAVEALEGTDMVVDHARALLTLGQIHRRFKEKSAARASLEAAVAIFDRLGAERFAERARQDLARLGGRAPGLALTETERRVALRAADGLTVRQIGDELFISPKTVEANLTRVYRKLGISGRAQLARWAIDEAEHQRGT